MWEISFSLELLNSLRALIFGVIIAFLYDFLKGWRIILKSSAVTVFLQDIIFSFLLGIALFCFFLVTTNGEIRGYIIISSLFGFLLYRISISRFILNVIVKLYSILCWLLRYFKGLLTVFFDKLFAYFEKIFKKLGFLLKKVLKKG